MSDTEESPAKKMKLSATGLPVGAKPLSHQVAGHITTGATTDQKKGNQGFYECDDGTILKALHPDPDPRGPREVDFYKKIFDRECKDPVVLDFRPFIPKYIGVISIPGENDKTVKYLQLEDIACKFQKPCVIDIKIGRITYDPLASEEKKRRERSKYPPLEKIGFQLRGFRVYSAAKGDFDCHSKKFMHEFDEETILTKGLKVFFTLDGKLQNDVVISCLEKLQAIQKWFNMQTQFAFFASSVLIVYEGQPNTPNSQKNTQNGDKLGTVDITTKVDIKEGDSKYKPEVDLRMIDFAHVFPGTGKDENYSYGLDSLINYLQRLSKEEK